MMVLIKSITHKKFRLDLILLIPRWSKCLTWLKTCFCHPAVIKYQKSPSFPKHGPKNIKFIARPQRPVCLCSSIFTRSCDFLAGWAISRNYSRSSWKWFRGNSLKSGSVTAVVGSSQGRILALSTISDINSPRAQSHARAGVRPPSGQFSTLPYHRWVQVQRHSQ